MNPQQPSRTSPVVSLLLTGAGSNNGTQAQDQVDLRGTPFSVAPGQFSLSTPRNRSAGPLAGHPEGFPGASAWPYGASGSVYWKS
ncbi:hypothetical protein [Corallococcus sicarius]|uniref:hypothetical protein n=1 Tax=Corallococcus sicarius TaxID=2316726 RepID=UPI0011C35404|nr:hypothetical protein [Corallococcus sicarius]